MVFFLFNFKEVVTSKARHGELMQSREKDMRTYQFAPTHKTISLKWVFKVKKENLGKMVKHKVRLIAKWHVQKQ